jgi:hypothetical protein
MMETKFFERGGEFYLIAYVSEPKTEVIKELNPREVLNSDHILLVAPNRTVEIGREMVVEMFPQRDEDIVKLAREKMDRDYEVHIIKSDYNIFAVRIPRQGAEDFTKEDGDIIKSKVQEIGRGAIEDAVSVFIIADKNWVKINPYRFIAEVFSERIIVGISQAEIKRLAYKKLRRTHKVVRELEILDASGIPYGIDFMAIKEGDRQAVFCTESASAEEMEKIETLVREIGISGVIVTGAKKGESKSDRVQVKTVSEL